MTISQSNELKQVLIVLEIGKSMRVEELKTQLGLDEKVIEDALAEGVSKELIDSYKLGPKDEIFYMRKDTHTGVKSLQPEGEILHVRV